MAAPGILYISYDGMLEPLGQSQVLAYLERLAGDYRVHLISFEKAADEADRERFAALQARIRSAGIVWHRLRYHKGTPSTAFDIAVGTAKALLVAARHKLRLVHARSYIPALIGLAVRKATGAKLLFDMRGLWADERVDAGIWPRDGGLYRSVKTIERRLLLGADHIVTLTHASAREIASFPYMREAKAPITVIPTCADLARFRRTGGEPPHAFTYGFVGAATTWSLFDQVLASFRLILDREPEARLLVVNRNEHDHIRRLVSESGVDPQRIELVAAEHREMPALISRMDAAAALRKPTYSQLACAPTKLAEYLGCGVPCLVNRGIGDVETIVEEDEVGAVAEDFSDVGMRQAVDRLLTLARKPGIREDCVASAHRRFSLEDGVESYRSVYRELLRDEAGR